MVQFGLRTGLKKIALKFFFDKFLQYPAPKRADFSFKKQKTSFFDSSKRCQK